MAKTKGLFVIKFSTGHYFCGHLSFDKQLRKAKIYAWKEAAVEYAEFLINYVKYNTQLAPSKEYKIVAITEDEWKEQRNC